MIFASASFTIAQNRTLTSRVGTSETNGKQLTSLKVNVFKSKFTKDKVWDVQRSPAYPVVGQMWTLSGLKAAFDASGKTIDWGVDRYLMFSTENDNGMSKSSIVNDIQTKEKAADLKSNKNANNSKVKSEFNDADTGGKQNITLSLYESNGTLVKVISTEGTIIGVGNDGFMYENKGSYGTFFSVTNNSLTKASVIKYKPSLAKVSKMSDLKKITVHFVAVDAENSELAFFNNKYTKTEVWDVKRSPAYPKAGQNWKLSGLQAPYDATTRNAIDWGVDRYLMFVAEVDNTISKHPITDDVNNSGSQYVIKLNLYEKDGTLVKIVSNFGKIYGMGDKGFLYECENYFGTFFSSITVNSSVIINYAPDLVEVTKFSELEITKTITTEEPVVTIVEVPTEIAAGYYTLAAECSGKMLDVLDASLKDGATIQQWKLNGNQAQHWKIDPIAGDPGYYTLTARRSGKLLDVLDASTKEGAIVQQWKLNGNKAQHWKIDPVKDAPGYYTLTARCSGKVLSVVGDSKFDGARIQQFGYTGKTSQHWKLNIVK